MKQTIDSLISASWVVPIQPAHTIYENHCIAINQGKIIDLCPMNEATTKYQANNNCQLDGHALIPGLINAHTHAAMSLMRGIADDIPLMDWLNKHIWPAEAKWVDPDFVHLGSQLAIAEMIKGGTTCFSDMYFFPDITAKVASDAGIRAVIGLILIDFPTQWAASSDEYIEKGCEIYRQYRDHHLISSAFAPHAPYTVSDEPFTKIQNLATQMHIPIHLHLHETKDEIQQSDSQYQKRPLARLKDLGLLSPSLIGVHMCNLNAEDIALTKASKLNVVHCPESNLKLASGFCPSAELLKAGVNVAIGTDGAASNNDLDMLGEIRTAALLAKGIAQDPEAVSAHDALTMGTLNGAKALGIEAQTGSLSIGKWADITAIDLNDICSQPVYDPVSHIVYAASRHQVRHVWIHGKQVLSDRKLQTLDEQAILQQTKTWGEKIKNFDEENAK
jgi:5-methylthioadenosine/S-adenosylhomocysteine deaminase